MAVRVFSAMLLVCSLTIERRFSDSSPMVATWKPHGGVLGLYFLVGTAAAVSRIINVKPRLSYGCIILLHVILLYVCRVVIFDLYAPSSGQNSISLFPERDRVRKAGETSSIIVITRRIFTVSALLCLFWIRFSFPRAIALEGNVSFGKFTFSRARSPFPCLIRKKNRV